MATQLIPLDSREKGRLAGYVKTVTEGQKTFVEVGNALACIQREKLYKGTHKTFEAFCKEHWGYAKSHTYRLIDAAGITVPPKSQKSPVGDKSDNRQDSPPIANERQARELASVPEEQRAAVMDWAEEKAGDKPVTAKLIREAIAEVAEAEPEEEESDIPEPTLKNGQPTFDPLKFKAVYEYLGHALPKIGMLNRSNPAKFYREADTAIKAAMQAITNWKELEQSKHGRK